MAYQSVTPDKAIYGNSKLSQLLSAAAYQDFVDTYNAQKKSLSESLAVRGSIPSGLSRSQEYDYLAASPQQQNYESLTKKLDSLLTEAMRGGRGNAGEQQAFRASLLGNNPLGVRESKNSFLDKVGGTLANTIHDNPWVVALPMAAAAAPALIGATGFGSSLASALGTIGSIPSTIGSSLGIGATGGAAVTGGLIGGASNYAKTHDLGSALKAGVLSGAGTYLGSMAGNAFFGDKLGTVGSTLDSAIGGTGGISNFIQNSIPAGLANTSIGSVIGGFAGNKVANDYADSMYGKSINVNPTSNASAAPSPFKPMRAGEQQLPLSLKGLGGLTSDQQLSNIATGGVYGGGEGPEENSYFLNMINRSLVDPMGNVKGTDSLSPITTSYLKQLGLGGFSNSNDLLQAISNWKQ